MLLVQAWLKSKYMIRLIFHSTFRLPNLVLYATEVDAHRDMDTEPLRSSCGVWHWIFWDIWVARWAIHGLDLFRCIPQILNRIEIWRPGWRLELFATYLGPFLSVIWQGTLSCWRGDYHQGVPLLSAGVQLRRQWCLLGTAWTSSSVRTKNLNGSIVTSVACSKHTRTVYQ